MKKKFQNIAVNFVFYFALLALWEAFGSRLIPAPTKIVATLVKIFPSLGTDLCYTLLEAFGGLLIGTVFALLVVTLMDFFGPVRAALSPLVVISQAIPFHIISPILIMLLGFGILPKLTVVSLVCFFPLTLTLLTAFDNVDKNLLDVARLFGASKMQTLRYLKAPLSVSNFFAGLKISAVYCISSAVISEWMSGDVGIGVYMLRAKRSYDNAKVFAVVLLITLLSILVYYVLEQLQKKTEKDVL